MCIYFAMRDFGVKRVRLWPFQLQLLMLQVIKIIYKVNENVGFSGKKRNETRQGWDIIARRDTSEKHSQLLIIHSYIVKCDIIYSSMHYHT